MEDLGRHVFDKPTCSFDIQSDLKKGNPRLLANYSKIQITFFNNLENYWSTHLLLFHPDTKTTIKKPHMTDI